MASEYFIQRQLDVLMEEPSNRNDWLWGKVEQDPVRRLEQLTRHHNGRIRQRAVLCLGLMHEVSALPSLIVRVNDWAVQVRAAARQSVRRFITPCHAAALVGRLPDFFHLLKGERDNHQRLVNEVIQFLIQTENRNVLFNGLNSHDRHVAKIVLQVLLEHQLFTPKVIYQQVKNHQSTAIRLSAAEAFIARSSWLSQDALMALLEQSSAPVKQITLQYIIDNQRSVPSRLMIPLLSDKSELVRKRAGRLLVADGFSPVEHYLTVLIIPPAVFQNGVSLCWDLMSKSISLSPLWHGSVWHALTRQCTKPLYLLLSAICRRSPATICWPRLSTRRMPSRD